MTHDRLFRLDADVPFTAVLEAARAGDNSAWARILERLAPSVSAAVCRRFGSAETRIGSAAEAVQSAYRTVFRRLRQGEFDLTDWQALTGLVIRVAWFKTCRMVRQSRGLRLPSPDETDGKPVDPGGPPPELLAPGATPLEEVLRAEMEEQVRLAIDAVHASLDEEDRLVLRCKLEHLSQEEIVEQLAVETGARRSTRWVTRHWARVLRQLQERLAEYAPEA